jgi:hypothetical protein
MKEWVPVVYQVETGVTGYSSGFQSVAHNPLDRGCCQLAGMGDILEKLQSKTEFDLNHSGPSH